MSSRDLVDPLGAFSLDEKVAVVTGASSGIGARTARVLDRLGATVVVSARRKDRIDALASSLNRGDSIPCDVSETGASESLIDTVIERHAHVDVVVANAGVTNTLPALREDIESFAHVVTVDLVAPFELSQAAAQHMREAGSGGTIVMVASAAAFHSTPLLPQAAYVAAKTGLVGLTRELALQWARYGVRVNALCPGMFKSEMTSELTDSDELRARFENGVPMGRIGQPHELDAALAFLASPASSYVTGTTLLVDGGSTLV